jgi:hypothetical protein
MSQRCPTCQSPEPRFHPAVSDGGEVTGICPDPFHDKVPVPPEAFAALRKSKQEIPVPDETFDALKQRLRAAARGDSYWDEPINLEAPVSPEYAAAHAFMGKVFGQDAYTPDAVGQLVEVFIPCLRIMVERGYEPNGELWRRAGVLGIIWDVRKKFERLWYRTWTLGKRHDDSGFDLINFTGMLLRVNPDSRFGDAGEPARTGEYE